MPCFTSWRPQATQAVNIDIELLLRMAKYAIVTGGNRGLGLELCRKLVLLNKPVILTARSAHAGKSDSDALIYPGHWPCSAARVRASLEQIQALFSQDERTLRWTGPWVQASHRSSRSMHVKEYFWRLWVTANVAQALIAVFKCNHAYSMIESATNYEH